MIFADDADETNEGLTQRHHCIQIIRCSDNDQSIEIILFELQIQYTFYLNNIFKKLSMNSFQFKN